MSPYVIALPILAIVAALLGALLNSPSRIGAAGERLVARWLAKNLPPEEYRIVNDLILPHRDRTTQIDHVVLSRFGIAVIETKTMSGWIFGDGTEGRWTQVIYGRKYRMQNPLHQNALHVRALCRLLGIPAANVDSFVVFMGSARPKTAMPPAVAWGARALGQRIRARREPVFTDAQLAAFEARLRAPDLASTRATQRAHVLGVKATLKDRAEAVQRCPECGAPLVQRMPRSGGTGFLGCSTFPKCRGTRPLAPPPVRPTVRPAAGADTPPADADSHGTILPNP
ncbi:NERD domain-containing protein [Pararhodobacter aggregans]|uniref:NERD domain-containing protein n=1 Tax=Pararhodobacter aggregans TaxID=404875 RepID=UPI000D4B4B2E|nr:NERD domain-containing protein [Pararhodobacter aggregans]PTX02471.1 topoisomerase-like DNA binding C4 zinc finger protein [Pararhodobacter aggregans]